MAEFVLGRAVDDSGIAVLLRPLHQPDPVPIRIQYGDEMFARLEDCQSHETRIATQEHNDFIHASTEVIKQVTKEVNGAKVPVWTPEEVEEVIVSQVPEMRSDNYGPTLNV